MIQFYDIIIHIIWDWGMRDMLAGSGLAGAIQYHKSPNMVISLCIWWGYVMARADLRGWNSIKYEFTHPL